MGRVSGEDGGQRAKSTEDVFAPHSSTATRSSRRGRYLRRLTDTELLGDPEPANPVVDEVAVDLVAEVGARVLQPIDNRAHEASRRHRRCPVKADQAMDLLQARRGAHPRAQGA